MRYKTVINIALGLVTAVVLFHALIIIKVVPYEIAWGGRIQNDKQMYILEVISISVNLLLGFVLLMKGGYIKIQFNIKTINAILWIFLILFALNTIGNLFAKTNFEKSFAGLTFIFSIIIYMLLKHKPH